MEQKTLLIKSMQKLINHIVINRKNQEEIFASLSRSDFQKIIENLDDDSERLRKTSMTLITLLLFNNPPLKQKFCSIMNIPLVPGRIALNNRLCSSSFLRKSGMESEMLSNMKEVYTLVRQPMSEGEQRSLYWFIHYDRRKEGAFQIEFVANINPQNIVANEVLDPIDCMVGFVLHQNNSKREARPQVTIPRLQKRQRVQQPKSNNEVFSNFLHTSYKQEPVKSGLHLVNFNQSLNLSRPGYATDRQMAPRDTKPIELTLPYHKNISDFNNSPRLQFKNTFAETERKQRKQMKTMTNSPNKRHSDPYEVNMVLDSPPPGQSGGWMIGPPERYINPLPPARQEYLYESPKEKRASQKYQA